MPQDVAAIMSWFHEDPRRLTGTLPLQIGGGTSDKAVNDEPSPLIRVAELNSSFARPGMARSPDEAGAISWARFMGQLLAAFRENRGPFGQTGTGHKGDDDDDDDYDGRKIKKPTPPDPAAKRSLENFKKLFERLLLPENAPRYAMTAFDLTQYICERLQPDFAVAKNWLDQLIDKLVRVGPLPERRDEIAAAILTILGASTEIAEDRIARGRLIRLGKSLSDAPPSPDHVRGYQSVLVQKVEFAELWERLQTVRTFSELAKSYVSDLVLGQFSSGYLELVREIPEEWEVLREALTSEEARSKVIILDHFVTACPIHNRTLPSGELQKLREKSIATAKSCCRKILICTGD